MPADRAQSRGGMVCSFRNRIIFAPICLRMRFRVVLSSVFNGLVITISRSFSFEMEWPPEGGRESSNNRKNQTVTAAFSRKACCMTAASPAKGEEDSFRSLVRVFERVRILQNSILPFCGECRAGKRKSKVNEAQHVTWIFTQTSCLKIYSHDKTRP